MEEGNKKISGEAKVPLVPNLFPSRLELTRPKPAMVPAANYLPVKTPFGKPPSGEPNKGTGMKIFFVTVIVLLAVGIAVIAYLLTVGLKPTVLPYVPPPECGKFGLILISCKYDSSGTAVVNMTSVESFDKALLARFKFTYDDGSTDIKQNSDVGSQNFFSPSKTPAKVQASVNLYNASGSEEPCPFTPELNCESVPYKIMIPVGG